MDLGERLSKLKAIGWLELSSKPGGWLLRVGTEKPGPELPYGWTEKARAQMPTVEECVVLVEHSLGINP